MPPSEAHRSPSPAAACGSLSAPSAQLNSQFMCVGGGCCVCKYACVCVAGIIRHSPSVRTIPRERRGTSLVSEIRGFESDASADHKHPHIHVR
jgi:hypothetical protein